MMVTGSCALDFPHQTRHHREGDHSMTDLERLGLALVGFPLAVVVGGVLLGLIGAWIKKAK